MRETWRQVAEDARGAFRSSTLLSGPCVHVILNPAEVPALHHHGHLQLRALLAAAAAAEQDPAAAAARHRAQQRQPAHGQSGRAGGGQEGLSPEHEEEHRYQTTLILSFNYFTYIV